MTVAVDPVSPVDEMRRVLDPRRLAPWDAPAGLGRLARFVHGGLHDRTAPMADHVIITYRGGITPVERKAEGRTIRCFARPETLTIIPAGESSRWDFDGTMDVAHHYVPAGILREMAEELDLPEANGLIPRTAVEDRDTSRLMLMLAGQNSPIDQNERMEGEWLARSLIARLLQCHASGGLVRNPLKRGGLSHFTLDRVVDYVVAHLADPLSLADLAGLTDLSVCHFARAFKQSTGVPPHTFVTRLRLARAMQLLRTTDLCGDAIAEAIGYSDAAYFARLFSREIGCGPLRYRNSCK